MNIFIPEIVENICRYLSPRDVHHFCATNRWINQFCRGHTIKLLAQKFCRFLNCGVELHISWKTGEIPDLIGFVGMPDFYMIFHDCVIVFTDREYFTNDDDGDVYLFLTVNTTIKVYPNLTMSQFCFRPGNSYLDDFKTVDRQLKKCSSTSIKYSDISDPLNYGKVATIYRELMSRFKIINMDK